VGEAVRVDVGEGLRVKVAEGVKVAVDAGILVAMSDGVPVNVGEMNIINGVEVKDGLNGGVGERIAGKGDGGIIGVEMMRPI
jgi:hypothetical protein